MSKKVLLYSGGMDSWLIDKLWKPDVRIFFDTGVDYDKVVKDNMPSDVIIYPLPISNFELKESKLLPLRNMLFLEIASYYGDEICLGAVNGDKHFDTQPDFLSKLENIINELYSEIELISNDSKQIKIITDFNNYTKYDLLKEYLEQGGDIDRAFDETFSCYTPNNDKECLHCPSCFRKCVPFILLGKTFTEEQKLKLKSFVNTYVKYNISEFENDDDNYTNQTLKAIEIIENW